MMIIIRGFFHLTELGLNENEKKSERLKTFYIYTFYSLKLHVLCTLHYCKEDINQMSLQQSC